MELTKNSITDVIQTGKAEHSELGQILVNLIWETLGIKIYACYVEAYTMLEMSPLECKAFDQAKRQEQARILQNAHLVQSCVLTVYLNHFAAKERQSDNLLKGQILAKFQNLLYVQGKEISYPRSLSPIEMKFYGMYDPSKKHVKRDSIEWIQPTDAPIKKDVVILEDIVDLAKWHYFSASLRAIRMLDGVQLLNAKVYYGWDDMHRVRFYVITEEPVSESIRGELSKQIFFILKKWDKLNIIDRSDAEPNIATWNSLSSEQKFCFLKD